MCLQCEAHYGAQWYWNPERWETVDGYVPFPRVLDAWRCLESLVARDILHQVIALALGGQHTEAGAQDAQRRLERFHDLAYPTEDRDDGRS